MISHFCRAVWQLAGSIALCVGFAPYQIAAQSGTLAVSDVSVTQSASLGSEGAGVIYSFTVSNLGPQDAEGVTMTNRLSAGAKVISVKATQGGHVVQDAQVVCNLGALPNGASASVILEVQSPPGLPTCSVSVASNGFDPQPLNNEATSSIVLPGQFGADGISMLTLPSGDLIYDPVSRKAFASVPSAGGNRGNSLLAIDPVTLKVDPPIPVGLDPGKLASDGQGRLFVAIDGESKVKEYDTATLAVREVFSYAAGARVYDLEVMSSSLPTLAVSTFIPGQPEPSASIYDGSVARAASAGVAWMEFSQDGSELYARKFNAFGNVLYRFAVRPNGLELLAQASLEYSEKLYSDLKFADGLLFLGTGQVFDAATLARVGTLDGVNRFPLITLDPARTRIFIVSQDQAGWQLQVFDRKTFALGGTKRLPALEAAPTSLIYISDERIALRSVSQLVFLSSSFLAPTDLQLTQNAKIGSDEASVTHSIVVRNLGPLDSERVALTNRWQAGSTILSVQASQGTCVTRENTLICDLGLLSANAMASVTVEVRTIAGLITNVTTVVGSGLDLSPGDNGGATSTMVPGRPGPGGISVLTLPTEDLVYDPVSQKVFATVPSAVANLGNSIVAIDPATLKTEAPVPIGLGPGKLATDGGGQLFVAVDGEFKVKTFDPLTRTVRDVLSITPGSRVYDLEVLPTSHQTLAVSTYVPGQPEPTAAIYDGSVARPATAGVAWMEFAKDGKELYARKFNAFGNVLYRFGVSSGGLELLGQLILEYGERLYSDLKYVDGLLYLATGQIIRADTLSTGDRPPTPVQICLPTGECTTLEPPNQAPPPPQVTGMLAGVGGFPLIAMDSSNSRIFLLSEASAGWQVQVFDRVAAQLTGKMLVPGLLGKPSALVYCSGDRIAFRTDGGQLFFVEFPPKSTVHLTQSNRTGFITQGDRLITDYKVVNKGPWRVGEGEITFRASLPSDLFFVSAEATSGVCTFRDGIVECPVPVLDPLDEHTVRLTAVPLSVGRVATSATISGAGHDPSAPGHSSIQEVNVLPKPSVVLHPLVLSEGDVGIQSNRFEIVLTNPSSLPVTLDYRLAEGTAKIPDDVRGVAGSLRFESGQTNSHVPVYIVSDRLFEADEAAVLIVTNVVNAILSENQTTLTIVNDDFFHLTVSDIETQEGDRGAKAVAFDVKLSAPSVQTVSVEYETVNETAVEGTDFLATRGTLIFAPGVTTQTVVVPVLGNTLPESNRTFGLRLSNGTNATIRQPFARCVLIDDDGAAGFQIRVVGLRDSRLSFSFPTVKEALYQVQASTNLLEQRWTVLTNSFGTGDIFSITDPIQPDSAPRFYRVLQLPR